MTEVFTCLRCCNVTLRWLFLHTCSTHKKLRAAVASSAPPMQDLLAVLLDTAVLEFEVASPAVLLMRVLTLCMRLEDVSPTFTT